MLYKVLIVFGQAQDRASSEQLFLKLSLLVSLSLTYFPPLGSSIAWTHGLHLHLQLGLGTGSAPRPMTPPTPSRPSLLAAAVFIHSSVEWSPCCPGCSRIWSSGQTQSSWENTPLDTHLSQPVPVSFKFYGKLGLHRVPLILLCNLVMARCYYWEITGFFWGGFWVLGSASSGRLFLDYWL